MRRGGKFAFVGGVTVVTLAGVLLSVHAIDAQRHLLRTGRSVPAKILSVSGNTSLRYEVSYVAGGRTYTTSIKTGNGHRQSRLTVTYNPSDPAQVTTGSQNSVTEDAGFVLVGAGVLAVLLPAASSLRAKTRPDHQFAAGPGSSPSVR